MALEMKVPSPGESISEVEIAEWLVKDGDYVEKDQPIAEVDSDKATLELPAEASGVITLKAEEGDVVEVGQVVCLIDTEASPKASPKASPSPSKGGEQKDSSDSSEGEESGTTQKEQEEKSVPPSEGSREAKNSSPSERSGEASYATGSPSPAAKKILDEKNIPASDVKGSGRDGRITKDDAVKRILNLQWVHQAKAVEVIAVKSSQCSEEK